LKSNEKDKVFVDIIYPPNGEDASAQDLALCEGFISRILSSTRDAINVSINSSMRLVESNEPNVKLYLDLILKSKKINNFYIQFKNLLHDRKTLRLRKNGIFIDITIKENGVYPDFNWLINKSIE
jgi:hypothetical protein